MRGAARSGGGYAQDYPPEQAAQPAPQRPQADPRLRQVPPQQQQGWVQAAQAAAPQFDPYVPPPRTEGRPAPDPRTQRQAAAYQVPQGQQQSPPGYAPATQRPQPGQPGAPYPAAPRQQQPQPAQARPPMPGAQQQPQAQAQWAPARPVQPQQAPASPTQRQARPPYEQPAPARGEYYPQGQQTQQAPQAAGRGQEPYFAGAAAPAPRARQGASPSFTEEPPAMDEGYGEGYEPEADAELDEDEGEDYAEERPRRRGLIVVGALVAAIVIGGGLGYAYKLSMGGHGGKEPVFVAADKSPVKTQVAAAAQASDAPKKTILERLDTDGNNGDAQANVVASSEPVQDAGAGMDGMASDQGTGNDAVQAPRKVATVVVKPGQPITAAPAEGMADAGAAGESIPGISLSSSNGQGSAAAAKPKTKVTTQTVVQAPAAPSMDAGAGDATAADAGTQDEAAPAAAPAAPVKPAKTAAKTTKKVAKPVVQQDAAADAMDAQPADQADAATMPAAKPAKTKVASAAASTGSGAGGFVAQVRSTKTQADALATFADLQQHYATIIGDAQPDIQEVDLGAKGKWYRLRIGPPGSGGAARDLCTKLKAAGLKDCIVAAY